MQCSCPTQPLVCTTSPLHSSSSGFSWWFGRIYHTALLCWGCHSGTWRYEWWSITWTLQINSVQISYTSNSCHILLQHLLWHNAHWRSLVYGWYFYWCHLLPWYFLESWQPPSCHPRLESTQMHWWTLLQGSSSTRKKIELFLTYHLLSISGYSSKYNSDHQLTEKLNALFSLAASPNTNAIHSKWASKHSTA